MSISEIIGFPTLAGFTQCRQVRDGLRCMLIIGHPERMHFNDITSECVYWDRLEIIREKKSPQSGKDSEGSG